MEVPACTHLDQIRDVGPASEGCPECVALGDTWVHLRLCLSCGHVGCCNESRNRHAHEHYATTGHPLIRSFEAGERWMWCYPDEIFVREGETMADKSSIRALALFQDLTDADLDRLFQMTDMTVVPAGETFIREGEEGSAMYVILEGQVEVTKRQGDGEVVLAQRGPPEVIGEMALLEQEPRFASCRAVVDTHLLVVTQAAFLDLMQCSHTAPLTMLRTVVGRLRSSESLLTQEQKLAALGRLSAGLAHELNNPAAAIRRGADSLHTAMDRWEEVAGQLSGLELDPQGNEIISRLRDESSAPTAPPPTDPLARSDREDTLLEWLEDDDVPQAWEIAPALVSAGWTRETLEAMLGSFSSTQRAVVLPWLAARSSAHELLSEVAMSAEAISQIVKAIKAYSYMDQAPVQNVDVHQSLETTLVILKHKLKEGITVVREYGVDVPAIEAYGSELNQVWTNIIDNAVDAMGGKGTLVLHTRREGDRVVVEIKDSGTGIPEDVRARLFEPFFTTKPMGSGTGLGLHIVHNIIFDKHGGQIDVESSPNGTCFRITLPLKLAHAPS